MVKRIFKIILATLALLMALVLGLGFFLYYQGPQYGLEKIRNIAKQQFQTEIAYKKAAFIGHQGFVINDLRVKRQGLDLFIKHFQILANINFKEKRAEIFEVLLDHPVLKAEIVSEEGAVAGEEPADSSTLESLLMAPPAQLKLHQIRIKNLSAQLTFLKKRDQSVIQKTFVSLNGLDFETQLSLLPGDFRQQINIQLNESFQFERSDRKQREFIELSQVNLKVASSVVKKDKDNWIYEFKPIEVLIQVKSAELKGDLSLAMAGADLKLVSEATLHSTRLFHFKPLLVDKIAWSLHAAMQKVKGEGKPAFRFFDKKGSDLRIDSQGQLSPAQAQSTRFDLPWTWDAEFKVNAGPFQVEGLKTSVKASGHWKDNKGRIEVATQPGALLKFKGASELQKKQLQLDGHLEANIPIKVAESLTQQKFHGTILMPVHLLVLPTANPNWSEISFETVLEFKDFHFANHKMKIEGLRGQIPISEQVIYNSEAQGLRAWSFKSLFSQNPFERVDYERLDPLVRSSDLLRIENVYWEGRTFGPIKGVFDVQQNLVSVHSFSMDFAQGSATGEMFLDLQPQNQRVGFLGRLTQLDLSQILPQRYLGPVGGTQTLPFSARTGLVLLAKRRSLDGRMDVTQIAGPQLIALVNVLDPNYENEKMNKVRSLLQVGYPTAVNLAFYEGALDLAVDIEALGYRTHQRLPGISIQSFIDKALKETMISLDE